MTRTCARVRAGAAWPAIGLALTLVACAHTSFTVSTPLAVDGREIAPFEFHEECGEIAAGERLDYRFTAKRPVHFEIYYIDGLSRIAPIASDDVTEGSGVYPPPATRRFCVRWDAGRAGAVVDYRIRILPPRAP